METTAKRTAVAYYRTSSAANVGADKDSEQRQRVAVATCAAARGLQIIAEFYDPAVSGADAVDTRPGFAEMMARLLGNGCRTIIVESAGRFARDLMTQETGFAMLQARGIELVAADAPDSFLSDTPTAVFVRQVLGAAAQLDKAMLVNKLRGARDRKSAALGRRIEGKRRTLPTATVDAARAARAEGLTLRAVAAELAGQGMRAPSGKPYGPQSIKHMLAR